jgi:phosphoribosylformimino-5-aminoimidazole carboxamide ribotide isomerase
MTNFRPCIDLHEGRVKQIVGGSLRDYGPGPQENFVSDQSAGWFAEKFRGDHLAGGHVIMLGAGNEEAAREALEGWPNGLQLGGGITSGNAQKWLTAGASHVIVTSWLFDQGARFQAGRLAELSEMVGAGRIVVDLSSRRTARGWTVAMNRWQTLTDLDLSPDLLDRLAEHCDEFLIHAADVEGMCGGIDAELVKLLAQWDGKPVTYAGGVATMEDVRLVEELSRGRVHVTVGSALDLFGGSGVSYQELLEWNSGARP